MPIRLEDLNLCDEPRFVELLGGVFEHSPWIAKAVFECRPFASRAILHAAMCETMLGSPRARQLELLRSHPELAGREAREGELTRDSRHEQSRAGLDRCNREELERIGSLNRAYRERFAFPFIIAVTGLDKQQIMAAMERRLGNERAEEFETALAEVGKIARIRIDALVDE